MLCHSQYMCNEAQQIVHQFSEVALWNACYLPASPISLAQVYAAAALIEWHGEKADTVPRKIFELGLQSFEAVAEYVLTYADFLWGLGDYDNMRALFERALAADSKTKKLWDRYIEVSLQQTPLSHEHVSAILCRVRWPISQFEL